MFEPIWKFNELSEKRRAEIIELNLMALRGLQSLCKLECANPLCKWPLSALAPEDERFDVFGVGRVCSVCKQMHWAVTQQKGLRQAHEDDERSRKRMGLDGSTS